MFARIRLIGLAMILVLLVGAAPRAAASTCSVSNYWGLCFETLPKLWCCTAAFLGWSEITVGDTFPVTGLVGQPEGGERTEALKIAFPSGRIISIAVEASGAFRQVVTFDEEGSHRLLTVTAAGEREVGRFTVAYRADLLDVPAVESQFGYQHARSGLSMGVVEAGKTVSLRIRFTDGKGEPVRARTLAISFGEQSFRTDEDGVATISYTPRSEQTGYGIDRLYPGLGVIAYRTVSIAGDGRVSGLPGGEVKALLRDGRWYLPLREFLEKAAPLRFGDMPERILWDGEARTINIEGLAIMIDTGMVLGPSDFRADLAIIDGRTYLDLHAMLRLLDQLGMAQRTGEFAFRLSLAQEP